MPKLPFQEVFTISLGAIFGANARYFVSRYCAKVLGPEFPYGTLLINVIGSLMVGFFVIRTRAYRPPLAAPVSDWILRGVHHFFQLRVRNHGVLRARAMGPDGS